MIDITVIGARGIPNVQGGLEKHAESLFPKFAANGFTIKLIGMKRYIHSSQYEGIILEAVPTVDFAKTDKLVYHLIAIAYVLKSRPKLLHLQGLNAALFLWLYRLLGFKIVLRYGSADYDYEKWGRVSSLILRFCEYQLRFAHHVITVSAHYRDALAAKHKLSNITVVPNGAECMPVQGDGVQVLQKYGLDGRPFILSVGRITPEKDYETLLKAFQKAGLEGYQLVVAGGSGDDDYASDYLAMNEAPIRFLGQVPRTELAALFMHCGLYVCASVFEGQSNAVLEAMAFNKPLIATSIPANMELELDPISYFEPSNIDALADKIKQAVKDPDPFTLHDRDLPTWDDVFHQTARVYRSVVPELGQQ